MKRWINKTFVVLVTMATFGNISPQGAVADNSDTHNHQQPKNPPFANEVEPPQLPKELNMLSVDWPDALAWQQEAEQFENREELIASFINYATVHASQVTSTKFGKAMAPRVRKGYAEDVEPGLKNVLRTLAEGLDDHRIKQLMFTSVPAGGTGEKIFHIYDGETGNDLFRFHVRRDHPPKDQYYFNFHYHTNHDNFQAHYEIASLPWGMNTPPHWTV
ncbi:hypothetical protein G4V62_02995 [Bacillaceae bacterium SIJ1]|uniref:YpjP family protein n=1 Tax=Litoribacterium kuwaitense TaxID=1398745 RepID=UPI0013EA291D|nr:YpjP family protein [Litoribacterium kuwaitense]NGP43965.1 hypothetical protein [Litoribacterium kuwaitense]